VALKCIGLDVESLIGSLSLYSLFGVPLWGPESDWQLSRSLLD
jgi:hypothetical protein